MPLPLFSGKIAAGFPSPADDHIEKSLDLNEHLIPHPAATFFARAQGNSMVKAGIASGDLLIIDRSLEPKNNAIVVAVVNGELTVKRLCLKNRQVWLLPENTEFSPLMITDGMDFHIWGIVTHVIHSF